MTFTKPRRIFFLGKGGVGKSTVAALSAVQFARRGEKVLLTSLDPAHNLSDIFQTALGEEPRPVAENLYAKEVNLEYWISRYLSEIENELRKTYRYLTALNLEKHFNIIRFSPGIEEYALLLAFGQIRKEFESNHILIFDLPPTGLTLKFLALPSLSLTWLNQLKDLRQEIIRKREMITTVKIGRKEIETDKVLKKLNAMTGQFESLQALLRDPHTTHLNLVLNPDELSFAESQLIVKRLTELGFSIHYLIMNKCTADTAQQIARRLHLPESRIICVPTSPIPLIGLPALREFLETRASENDFTVL